MKHYIFGGNGFVGQYLANELLTLDKKVVVCDLQEKLNNAINASCEYCQVDIRRIENIQKLSISKEDVVINLAANQYHTKVPRNRKEYFFSVNAVGTENILETIYEKGCRNFLIFTTDMTYGKPLYLPVNTQHPQLPFGPYGQSKKAAEEICRKYREKGMNITIMRPRMINGPGRLGILVKLFKLIDMGLPVPTIGSGKNHYQMISVFDCVSAAICALDRNLPNKEYNLGSKESPNVKDLLKSVIGSAGSKSIVIPTPEKLVKFALSIFDAVGLTIMYKEQFMIADEEYVLDISDTEKDLNWTPKFNDADMIKQAYHIYKKGVSI
ncbi:MAG: NAD(P)-dependent oxidoreductase [Chitinivibrionia bacterium]|nr:NAD(P)-dependent oxidoreductase [Chitinivibrionia bacterium]